MVPSFFTPVLMYIFAPERMVVEIVSSALSRTIITGRLALMARRPQIGSMAAPEGVPLPLPPEPAPKPAEDTRNLVQGNPGVSDTNSGMAANIFHPGIGGNRFWQRHVIVQGRRIRLGRFLWIDYHRQRF